ncbi:MAG: hypothetical protein NZ455_02485 [Bacteroidia bacterium]|nr:hypothetical protein [Bacteroidia bacterium]
MGVSLWAFRCAHAHKVGVLRADGATLRYAPSLTACPSHASRKRITQLLKNYNYLLRGKYSLTYINLA